MSLVPYVLLPGTARAALTRYAEIFGGELELVTYAEMERTDGPADAIGHGQLAGPVVIFAADAAPGEESVQARGLLLSLLGTEEPDVMTRWFAALAEDGEVLDDLQQRPWGDWDGQVRDRFGLTWLIGFAPDED